MNQEGEGAQVVPGQPPGQLAQLGHDGGLESVVDLGGRAAIAAAAAAASALLARALAAGGRVADDLGGLRGRSVGVPLSHIDEFLQEQKRCQLPVLKNAFCKQKSRNFAYII